MSKKEKEKETPAQEQTLEEQGAQQACSSSVGLVSPSRRRTFSISS